MTPAMKDIHCLFRDGVGLGPVVAIQESFGRQFHRLQRSYNAGEIVDKSVRTEGKKHPMTDSGQFPMPMKIIASAHFNAIAAILRKHRPELRPDKGYWHEVHSD